MKKRHALSGAAFAATPSALVGAAVTTGSSWLYAAALVATALPVAASLLWRCIFAAKPAAVRRDLLELVKIENQ
ncbi:hypothetical protein [Actinokineospora bangkokensis]|nr:hypothetical protein [Actinokineospora bangkokensis]